MRRAGPFRGMRRPFRGMRCLTWNGEPHPAPGAATARGQRPTGDGHHHGRLGGRAGGVAGAARPDPALRAVVDLDVCGRRGDGLVRAVVCAPDEAGPRPRCGPPCPGTGPGHGDLACPPGSPLLMNVTIISKEVIIATIITFAGAG